MNNFKEKKKNFENIPSASLVEYYKNHDLNPVPLPLNSKSEWEEHINRRKNLYENHLKIPTSLFKNKNIIEFGCNSGENALYLAHLGGKLTLVEPNEKVHPRLINLFKSRDSEKSIVKLSSEGIQEYETSKKFDFVILEGFLNALQERESILRNICKLIKPGGFGIVTEDDRYGCFVECIKQITLKRVCELSQINFHSEESYLTAVQLFGKEYEALNTTRPILTWWKDAIVSPYNTGKFLWSFLDVINLIELENCEFWSSSPNWSSVDRFKWYKNTQSIKDRHRSLRHNFKQVFPYFITGMNEGIMEFSEPTIDLINNISLFIDNAGKYTTSSDSPFNLELPNGLRELLLSGKNKSFDLLSDDIEQLFITLSKNDPHNIIKIYRKTKILKSLWGNTMFYLTFKKI